MSCLSFQACGLCGPLDYHLFDCIVIGRNNNAPVVPTKCQVDALFRSGLPAILTKLSAEKWVQFMDSNKDADKDVTLFRIGTDKHNARKKKTKAEELKQLLVKLKIRLKSIQFHCWMDMDVSFTCSSKKFWNCVQRDSSKFNSTSTKSTRLSTNGMRISFQKVFARISFKISILYLLQNIITST